MSESCIHTYNLDVQVKKEKTNPVIRQCLIPTAVKRLILLSVSQMSPHIIFQHNLINGCGTISKNHSKDNERHLVPSSFSPSSQLVTLVSVDAGHALIN